MLNEVTMTYDEFAQLTAEAQEHSGAVSSSPTVSYAYANGGSSSNQIRLTSITYPGGRQIDYNYGSGTDDDRLSRVTSIKDGSTALAAYTYLGLGTVIQIVYAQPGVQLDLWGGTSGTFAGIDGFGRVSDQRWVTIVYRAAHELLVGIARVLHFRMPSDSHGKKIPDGPNKASR